MNKWGEIIVGLVLLIGMGLIAYYSQNWVWLGRDFNFLHAAWVFLKGGIFWLVVMIGLALLIIGISELRESE